MILLEEMSNQPLLLFRENNQPLLSGGVFPFPRRPIDPGAANIRSGGYFRQFWSLMIDDTAISGCVCVEAPVLGFGPSHLVDHSTVCRL